MVKIVITSDVHGRVSVFKKIAQRHQDVAWFIDAGDSESNETAILPFISVEGNNDVSGSFPKSRVIEVGRHKIYVSHSHEFFVSQRDAGLVKKAQRLGCGFVVYGHSHVPNVQTIHGVTLINPGSLYYNRDRSPIAYTILTLEEAQFTIERMAY